MSLVVSDTTPLNYLIVIGHIEVLPRLFGKLLVPPSVIRELKHPKAPPPTAAWAHNLPDWIDVRMPRNVLHLGIDVGEDEAISLAVELGNVPVLLDDGAGRAAARNQKLRVIGTLTVLQLADAAGLLEFEEALARLRTTTFRAKDDVVNTARAKIRARKKP